MVTYCTELWCYATFGCMFAVGAFIFGDATMSIYESHFESMVVYGSMVVMNTELTLTDLGEKIDVDNDEELISEIQIIDGYYSLFNVHFSCDYSGAPIGSGSDWFQFTSLS